MELEGIPPKTLISAEFAKALVKYRADLKSATKDASNPFFKTKYADLASIIDAAREPLSKNGLSYIQVVHDADAAKIETILVHESGETLSCGIVSIMPTKRDAQGFGSAITYARRYSLQSALGVAAEDDDGNEAAKPTTKGVASKPIPPPPMAQVEEPVSADPHSFFWYNFAGVKMDKDAIEFLKRRNCVFDDGQGLWYCPKELPKSKDGYRAECPYVDAPQSSDEVAA